MHENLESATDTVVNVAVAEAKIAAVVADVAVVAIGAAPIATSYTKSRMMYETLELSYNRNEDLKIRLTFKIVKS